MCLVVPPVKPVAIFRHSPTEGPGYFATFLDRAGVPWQLIKVDAGEMVPASVDQFGGRVFMGGPMSVNDQLAWIPPVLDLIRQAVARDVPVLGHCLGGQLISKALGGTVSRTPIKEIGWGRVHVAAAAVAQTWFGPAAMRSSPSSGTVKPSPFRRAPRRSVQPLVPEPGLRPRSAPGTAMSHRNDRGTGAQLV